MTSFFDEQEAREASAMERRPKNRRGGRKAATGVALLVTTALVVLAVVVAWPRISDALFTPAVEDYTGAGETELVVEIPSGATGTDIANILFEKDVVKSAPAFRDAFTANPRANAIQAGSYTLKTKMSAANALAALLDPASRAEVSITIPEGFTINQVYARIAKVLGVTESEVKSAAKDTVALGLPAEAKGNLEGWISPLTYSFAPGTTAQDALKTMVAKRVEELDSLGLARDKWQRTITIASIVEREVNWPEYYGQVARVIENRLAGDSETNGLLQMDSTVMYGLGKTGGVPTAAQKEQDTPYNSYKHAGLPPTPISNPSLDVIKATLNPPAGQWLYFVTVNLDTGETKFSSTYEEHKKYVAEFRAWYEANGGN